MIAINLQQAKAKLNYLVRKAIEGEQVVLLKGSKIIASILPLSEKNLEIVTHLTDEQAEHFWEEVAMAKPKRFRSMKAAVQQLKNR
ncbi:MAG: hypothetical protein HYU97_02765 [Deltaproteobacteria bacterium]|nr:hypothetical protein [Deltaproteobacteria bacterium]